jgi:hypothetical protein
MTQPMPEKPGKPDARQDHTPRSPQLVSSKSPPGMEPAPVTYFPVTVIPSGDFLDELGVPQEVEIPPDLIVKMDICRDMPIGMLADMVRESQGLQDDLDLMLDTGQSLRTLDNSYPAGYYHIRPYTQLVYDWCQH